MKRFFFTLFIALCVMSLSAENIRYMRIEQTNGTVTKIPVNTISSINFIYEESTENPDDPELPDFNGHEYVDLGLPSGTLWATCNVGASKPEEYGDYFAWGETTTKESYYWDTYKWCNYDATEDHVAFTKYWVDYSSTSHSGTVDNKTVLAPEDDAAHVNWGGDWRMPTLAEMQELLDSDNCTWEWTTQNGVYGRKVTSVSNGNSIFLPAAGYRTDLALFYDGSYGDFWSSSLNTGYPLDAYTVLFNSDDYDWYYYGDRCLGLSVRAVCSK